jgi:hypothetical protein
MTTRGLYKYRQYKRFIDQAYFDFILVSLLDTAALLDT